MYTFNAYNFLLLYGLIWFDDVVGVAWYVAVWYVVECYGNVVWYVVACYYIV
jgi:hypothetical protein